MNRPIKIGFLSLYPGVYSVYVRHLTAAIFVGTNKNTSESCKKIEFVCDMGAHIAYFSHVSPSVFYCSQHRRQSEYALGRWAGHTFGTGAMITPLYEAGHHLDKAFRKGTLATGQGGDMMQHMLPFDQGDPGRRGLTTLFAAVKRTKPAYVHAIFGGAMGIRFFQRRHESDLHQQFPLLVNEAMAYEDMLEDVQHLRLKIDAPSQWSHHSVEPCSRAFIKKIETLTGQKPNAYILIIYESGLVLKELGPELVKRDWEAVKTLLEKIVIRGPRGDRNFYPASGFALPETDIVRIKTDGNRIHIMIVDRGHGLRHDAPEFEEIHRECVTDWQNPFLCI